MGIKSKLLTKSIIPIVNKTVPARSNISSDVGMRMIFFLIQNIEVMQVFAVNFLE